MTEEEKPGLGDFHSHLVPGVDDGARDLEDSLRAVDRMVNAGISRIITTPHLAASVIRDPASFAGRMEIMDEAWARVSAAVEEADPHVEFRRGHEILLDVPDADLTDPRLHLGEGSFALVEWPLRRIPTGSEGTISRIRSAGLYPVVAHPERYPGIGKALELAESWRREGAFLQINYGSLVGRFGPAARDAALRLLERGWADYLCTDFHGRAQLDLLIEDARMFLLEAGGEEQWRLLSQENPLRLVDGELPLPIPPLAARTGFWKKVRVALQRGSP